MFDIMKKVFGLRDLLLILLLFSAQAVFGKRIYVFDCSGSMAGYNGAENIYAEVLTKLNQHVESLPDSAHIAILSFSDAVYSCYEGIAGNAAGYIASMKVLKGNSDIKGAWVQSLSLMDSSSVNILFLITDCRNNIGRNSVLLDELRKWPTVSGVSDYAYLYVADESVEDSEIAGIFVNEDRMDITYSFDVSLPEQKHDIAETPVMSVETLSSESDDASESGLSSLLRCLIWILLFLLICVLVFLVVKFIVRIFSAGDVLNRFVDYPLSEKGYRPRLPSGNNPKRGYWDGERGNSNYHLNPDAVLKRGLYTNSGNMTVRDLFRSIGDLFPDDPTIPFRNGFPVFNRDFMAPGKEPFSVDFPEGIDKFLDRRNLGNRQALHTEAFRRMMEKYGLDNIDMAKVFKGDSEPVRRLAELWNCTEEQVWEKCNNPGRIQRVWHEEPDMKTLRLVPRVYHDLIDHSGGVEMVKRLFGF